MKLSCGILAPPSTCEGMATRADLLAAVDAFMAAPKRIVGYQSPPPWGEGWHPDERVMRFPLEVGGEQGGSQLMVVGFPHQRDLKFRLGILFPGMVCRLDYTGETHANTVDGVLSGVVPATVTGPHYHSWQLNRRFFKGVTKPPKLPDAVPYPGGGRSFDAVLRWFCTDTNIESLPPGHRIELPPSELLL